MEIGKVGRGGENGGMGREGGGGGGTGECVERQLGASVCICPLILAFTTNLYYWFLLLACSTRVSFLPHASNSVTGGACLEVCVYVAKRVAIVLLVWS